MIKPEELRSGKSIVYVNNPKHHPKLKGIAMLVTGITPTIKKGKETYSISLEHINQKQNEYYETFSQFIKYIEPIELTEEWLIKFGWISHHNFFSKPLSENGIDTITFSNYYKKYQYQLCAGKNKILESVHQLQNLYFALTNKELTIK